MRPHLRRSCTNDPNSAPIPDHDQGASCSRVVISSGSLAGLGALGASTAAYGFGVEPVLRLRVTRYDSTPRQWPADLQLKIAVIADLHACDPWMSLERIEAIVERTNALNADVIVMLGDYVAGHRHVTRFIPAERMGAGARGVEGAARRARDPRQSRLVGRQDRAAPGARADRRPARARGRGDSGLRKRRRASDQGRPSVLARRSRRSTGLSSGAAFSADRRIGVDDLAATLAKVTDDAPVILLAHEPDIALRVPARVALQLSGHTHGGQVRLFGWSPALPARHGIRLAYGHMRTNCDVIVSGGLGCSIMPFRVGVPPEIVLVTLGKAGPAVA